MRKTICACVLVLALCGSALAGDIECPPLLAPCDINNPPPAARDVNPLLGATPSPDDQIADALVEAALNVLNSVLSLL